MRFQMIVHELQHERQGEGSMDQEIAVTFNITSVVGIKVNEMSIESESRETEQKCTIGSEGMGEERITGSYK